MQSLSWSLIELIKSQDGVVTRRQLIEHGLNRSQAIQPVRVGRWRQLYRGVFVTHLGPVSDRARVQGALLMAGSDAAAALETALWLLGFADEPPAVVQICIPIERTAQAPKGVRIIRRTDLVELVHPSQHPRRVRFEVAILDVADTKRSADSVITLVLSAIQRRFTTAERLRAELVRRPRHRHRALIVELLSEAAAGVLSALERRYLRDVERPHGLPNGTKNKRRRERLGRPYYDVDYRRWQTIVELDGRAAHPEELVFRDHHRDNTAAEFDEFVLRYGWVDVVAHPCDVAWQVAKILWRHGWTGTFTRCRRCPPPGQFHDREEFAAHKAAKSSRS